MGIVPAPGLARSSGTSTVPQRRSPRRAHALSNDPAPDGEGDGSTRRSREVHEATTSTAAPRTAPRAEGRIRVRFNPETPFRSDGAGGPDGPDGPVRGLGRPLDLVPAGEVGAPDVRPGRPLPPEEVLVVSEAVASERPHVGPRDARRLRVDGRLDPRIPDLHRVVPPQERRPRHVVGEMVA